MWYSMQADVAVGPAIFILGGVAAAVLFLVVMLVEAVVLRALKWGTFRRSLLDAFFMNLVSALPGAIIGFLGLVSQVTAVGLLAALAASIMIEGLVLTVLRRRPPAETWRAAVLANIISYIPVALFLMGS